MNKQSTIAEYTSWPPVLSPRQEHISHVEQQASANYWDIDTRELLIYQDAVEQTLIANWGLNATEMSFTPLPDPGDTWEPLSTSTPQPSWLCKAAKAENDDQGMQSPRVTSRNPIPETLMNLAYRQPLRLRRSSRSTGVINVHACYRVKS
ncbi:hypothetical protein DAEQUDRAFT_724309 [Daedalea quercina L-15889]|uniref:Uncharacterized protein n=1 Tax=Daedalea quercina L-15889 TaxID=1314783 RepID=A0A165RZQ9_9APHY|nr:hypothetical protein DAEQUDRAFT_724309 [Daedalea quercina L-15889]